MTLIYDLPLSPVTQLLQWWSINLLYFLMTYHPGHTHCGVSNKICWL